MQWVNYCDSPIGKIAIAENGKAITHIFLTGEMISAEWQIGNTVLLQKAVAELGEYFDRRRQHFTVPLAPEGTSFMQSVWQRLRTIPYGETRSYGAIASEIGKPKAARAVGMANHRNPILIMIPCHRVIGKDGSLTGFGSGLDIKQQLLDLEQIEP